MSELILSLLSKYSWQKNPVWLLEFEQPLEGTKDDLNEQALSLHRAANTLAAAQEQKSCGKNNVIAHVEGGGCVQMGPCEQVFGKGADIHLVCSIREHLCMQEHTLHVVGCRYFPRILTQTRNTKIN